MKVICMWLALSLACLAQATPVSDTTCNNLLDFARSGAKTPPEGLNGSTLNKCAQLAAARTQILRNVINVKTDPPLVANGIIRAPKTDDPPETLLPTHATFFAFQSGDSVSEVASRFRRDIQTLLEAVSGYKYLFFWSHSGNIQAVLKKDNIDSGIAYLEIADAEINLILDQLDLLEPFAALLQTYLVPFASTGSSEVPSALTATNQQNQVKAAGFLDFESEHFSTKKSRAFDTSFGGRFGIGPTQTLVKVSGLTLPDGTADNRVFSLYQNALIWELNGRLNAQFGKKGEVSLPVFRFGETLLLDDSVLVGPKMENTTSLVQNNVSRNAWYWELGPEYRLYPFLMQRVHDQKKFLLPSFSLSSGFKKEHRFQYFPRPGQVRPPGLQANGLEDFAQPTKRWYVSAFVTLTNVGERNFDESKPTKTFNVAIGVEYEEVWGHRGGREFNVPPGTKIFINASVDLVKAFTKQGGS